MTTEQENQVAALEREKHLLEIRCATLTEFIERINIAHVGQEPIGDHLAMALHYIRGKK